ncbi:hypothetical protein TNCV_376811 [Trichonephila clavipes]|nr:hypothetical protein TNCV_376811 [Trichonephila clavipes]
MVCVRGCLVVMVMGSRLACRELESITAEYQPCRRGRYTLSKSRLKRTPVGVVWKLGQWVPAQGSTRHLTMVQNYNVRRQKPSCS